MTVKGKPIIAITMGDAAGIGPEIIVKALQSEYIYDMCRPLLIGDGGIMADMIGLLGSGIELHPVNMVDEVKGKPGTIDLLDLHNLDRGEVTFGRVSPACGRAAMQYVVRAAELIINNTVKAMVTAPINKEAITQAGCEDTGHLEFLARLTHATEYAGMLVTGPLRVVHLTTHYSLKDACELVTKERILARLWLIHDSFRQWGVKQPRIGVAALNPHSGDGGLFGSEEIEQIAPAVKAARDSGIDAQGPYPADSIFIHAIDGDYDVVLAMYHDQGHIPIKVYNFERSVGIALGLPFVRTSVDHGTAFDIAGKGIADCRSLEEAVIIAVNLVEGRIL